MSAIGTLMGDALVSYDGNMNEKDNELCDTIVRKFSGMVRETGAKKKIPASNLSIFKMNCMYIAKDKQNYHFAFVEKAGGTHTQHDDLSQTELFSEKDLVQKLTIEIGNVHWIFSIPVFNAKTISDNQIEKYAEQYIEAVLQANISEQTISVSELAKFIGAFRKDYPIPQKTAFLMMKFDDTKEHSRIVSVIKETLKIHNIIGLRADDKQYSDDLFSNVRTYMHCCDFGIAIFERLTKEDFNPNVSLEVGYMMGLGKPVCLLKDRTLNNLHTDLTGKLYKAFDTHDVENTLPEQLEKWLKDKEIILDSR